MFKGWIFQLRKQYGFALFKWEKDDQTSRPKYELRIKFFFENKILLAFEIHQFNIRVHFYFSFHIDTSKIIFLSYLTMWLLYDRETCLNCFSDLIPQQTHKYAVQFRFRQDFERMSSFDKFRAHLFVNFFAKIFE